MLFIKSDNLKVGMRLARPIYNRNGTLLYERNSKLTIQGITSIKNFGLIGIYILEEAEPVPPMSKDDIEFERFQTISVFSLRDELSSLLNKQESKKLYTLSNSIIKSYGNLYHKINFSQNLRSMEDYIYKHSLNVAILSALISHQLDFTFEEQLDVVMAALLHDLNKLLLPRTLIEKDYTFQNSTENTAIIRKSLLDAQNLIQYDPNISSNVKIMMNQHHQSELGESHSETSSELRGTMVIKVAEVYDSMTSMKSYCDPTSEVTSIRYLLANKKKFDTRTIMALIDSVHILPAGVCVALTDSDTGIVIAENHNDVLRPVILSFNHNTVYDLTTRSVFNKLQVLDVMKSLDNRFVMDRDLFREYESSMTDTAYPEDSNATVIPDEESAEHESGEYQLEQPQV